MIKVIKKVNGDKYFHTERVSGKHLQSHYKRAKESIQVTNPCMYGRILQMIENTHNGNKINIPYIWRSAFEIAKMQSPTIRVPSM
jgi:hypothetical protein